MQSPLYLGIDGGGTHCRARLTDAAGTLLGTGEGGGANIRLGLEMAWGAVLDATDQALIRAGLGADAYARIHIALGLAGIVKDGDVRRVEQTAPVRFATITVHHDAHIACLGAHGGGDGAILVAGTGSAGYLIIGGAGQGIGGWGFEVSDDGSGAALGRAAIRAALHGHDGIGPQTDFTRAVLQQLGGSPASVVDWVGHARPADYGALAPLAVEWARRGDRVADRLLREQADLLTAYIRRLRELGAPSVCLMGGLAPVLRDWMPPWVAAVLSAPQGDALDGALLMARASAL